MNTLSNTELLEKLKTLVKQEREVTYEVLIHLREVERRMLFAQLGYSSLFSYAMGELKYSEDESAQRIAAMRLLREVPEIETSIKLGELSLSNLSQARSYFKAQGIKQASTKKEILQKLENKSRRHGEFILARLPLSENASSVQKMQQEKRMAEIATLALAPDLQQKLEVVRKF